MQTKIDFSYLNQSFMPVNINLYEIDNFESNHFGDSTTTLETLRLYSMKEPNTDHRQGRPETGQLLLAYIPRRSTVSPRHRAKA